MYLTHSYLLNTSPVLSKMSGLIGFEIIVNFFLIKFRVMTKFLEINQESFKCFNEQVVLWVTGADGLREKLSSLYPSNPIPPGHVTPHRETP